MQYKNLFIIGDERVLEDRRLYDSDEQKKINRSNYLLNRIVGNLPKKTPFYYLNYEYLKENDLRKFNLEESLFIVHADQTIRDEKLINIINKLESKGVQVWNSRLTNISKKYVDTLSEKINLENLLITNQNYKGTVLLKTDNNAGDVPKDLIKYQYQKSDSKDIPKHIWNDKRMVITKYIDSSISENSKYGRIDRVYFFGNEHLIVSKFGKNKSKIKSGDIICYSARPFEKLENDLLTMNKLNIKKAEHSLCLDNLQQRALNKTKEIKEILNMNFGAIEFISSIKNDQSYLMDINYTSYSSDVNDLFIQIFTNELEKTLKK